MTIAIVMRAPRWAPVNDPIELMPVIANRGPEPIYVNKRLAIAPHGTAAEATLSVIDATGQPMASRWVDVPPPAMEDFVWLAPGKMASASLYDVLWDHALPIGRYELALTIRFGTSVPPSLHQFPVHRETVVLPRHRLDVIPWGYPPPR